LALRAIEARIRDLAGRPRGKQGELLTGHRADAARLRGERTAHGSGR
jgi:hypothetical protein